MPLMQITEKVDLEVYYQVESARYDPATLDKMGVNKEIFIAYYESCHSVGLMADGKPIGGILLDGDQFHLAVLPEYHGRWRHMFPEMLQRCFSLRDRFFANVDIDNEKCIRFMDSMQWPRVKCTESCITYEIADYGRLAVPRRMKEVA